ncbi:TolC family protein [Hymenobacter sp. ISL-91]|uniref:TolC family protein n=1 Tax=Hymenobacter sp. ISL-91 TaxID=2819151 RepID=UPI001BE9C259|nr:TolC family protein [Hymenobacter sp. ISL-91]MBT2556617.1 TolC family protein [Hymenobacter sp. ISL-91]
MKPTILVNLLTDMFLLLLAVPVQAQQTEQRVSVARLFELTRQNHPKLKVAKADIDIARQSTEVAKNAQLPSVSAGLQGYYLGNAVVLDKDFSNATKVDIPHHGTSFSTEANWLVWKGGLVRNSIQIQSLKEGLMQLNYESNEQNIKLLVLGHYLDVYKLLNQEKVYTRNIALAERRLQNIQRLYKEGLVTRNDVVRAELQLSNLNLARQVVQNNRAILNKQLTVALGLPDEVVVVPEEALLATAEVSAVQDYQLASKNHPSLLLARRSVEVYDVADKVIRAERSPSLSLFSGNKLQRPLTTSVPALDMYSNGWSTGLSLNINLDALYKTPRKVQLNRFEQDKAQAQANDTEQQLEVAVNASYIKYHEAVSQRNTYGVQKSLAAENYRIMESKYNNQLAILLDLLDASNAKLDAELQFTNAEANIVFSYYKLLKDSGQL